jgi:cell division protein FtsL
MILVYAFLIVMILKIIYTIYTLKRRIRQLEQKLGDRTEELQAIINIGSPSS